MQIPLPMARSVLRLAPVHVVIAVPQASLRTALAAWLQRSRRVRIVRAVAHDADLGAHPVDCDLVISSALAGPRELRALAKRFGGRAGLVAISLGSSGLPAGWSPLVPGVAPDRVLELAIPHPERSVARTWTVNASIVVALITLLLSGVYLRTTSMSYEIAALAYAARFPDSGTWWHIWGAGAPYLASAAWPLIRLAALASGSEDAFRLIAGLLAAACAVAFTLVAVRLGARRLAPAYGLIAAAPPALWAWPRGGDASSLAGLAGLALTLAGTRVGRLRVAAIAFPIGVASFGGYVWVAACALVAIVAGIRARRARASLSGAVLGVLLSSAVAAPPVLARGLDGLRPPLARLPALSDLAPLAALVAIVALLTVRDRLRIPAVALATVLLVGANALAYVAPVARPEARDVASTGALGRLAVHPAQALSLAAAHPDLPTTGADLAPGVILGESPRSVMNARLEWEGADRALPPDRSSGLVFNEREWPVLDRDQLLFRAPRVRPILTAGVTPTILVVADEGDARTFGDALIQLGSTSERVIPLRATKRLDQLDRDVLRQFTMVAVYGQPWTDIGKAADVLDQYLQLSGFVFMDPAAHAGPQPLLPDAQALRATADDVRADGEQKDLITAAGFAGPAVAISPFQYRGDPGWERAHLSVGSRRVIEFGSTKVAAEVSVSAHLVWSGVDLPARAAAGQPEALAQLQTALAWMLGAARVTPTAEFGTPSGDRLDNDTATSTFIDPTHWRIELHAASTGVLFKERYHPQWRAVQVDIAPLSGLESRTTLPITPTTHGYMYVPLPANARTIEFVFERHPYESAARGVSGVALFATIGVTLFLWRRR